MIKKYGILREEFMTTKCGQKLYRIKALRSFSDVKKGDIGGWIGKEDNLSQDGNCWIYENAKVCENAKVYGYSLVFENARVFGNARVSGHIGVYGDAEICENVKVCGHGLIFGYSKIYSE